MSIFFLACVADRHVRLQRRLYFFLSFLFLKFSVKIIIITLGWIPTHHTINKFNKLYVIDLPWTWTYYLLTRPKVYILFYRNSTLQPKVIDLCFMWFTFTRECNETNIAVERDMQIFTRSLARSMGCKWICLWILIYALNYKFISLFSPFYYYFI